MRPQYHLRRRSTGQIDAWDVRRLIALTAGEPVVDVPLTEIAELDTSYWYDHGESPTVRSIVDHLRLVIDAEPGFPIVLDPHGRVMDGMHRVARALLDGRTTIGARRLRELPEPDHRDCDPDDLPY